MSFLKRLSKSKERPDVIPSGTRLKSILDNYVNPTDQRKGYRDASDRKDHSASNDRFIDANSSSQTAPPRNLSRSFDAPPTYELSRNTCDDQYDFLSTFDTVFLIDDSGSMAGRSWKETAAALERITPIYTKRDTDGIDIYFLDRPDRNEKTHITSRDISKLQECPTISPQQCSLLDDEDDDSLTIYRRFGEIHSSRLPQIEDKLRKKEGEEGEEEKLNWEKRQDWARKTIQGLSEIHKAGFIQGDFTPSSIIDNTDTTQAIDINHRGCPTGQEIATRLESDWIEQLTGWNFRRIGSRSFKSMVSISRMLGSQRPLHHSTKQLFYVLPTLLFAPVVRAGDVSSSGNGLDAGITTINVDRSSSISDWSRLFGEHPLTLDGPISILFGAGFVLVVKGLTAAKKIEKIQSLRWIMGVTAYWSSAVLVRKDLPAPMVFT